MNVAQHKIRLKIHKQSHHVSAVEMLLSSDHHRSVVEWYPDQSTFVVFEQVAAWLSSSYCRIIFMQFLTNKMQDLVPWLETCIDIAPLPVGSATFCTLCHLHNCDPMVFGCSGATNLGTAMPLVIWPHLLDALEIFEALPWSPSRS